MSENLSKTYPTETCQNKFNANFLDETGDHNLNCSFEIANLKIVSRITNRVDGKLAALCNRTKRPQTWRDYNLSNLITQLTVGEDYDLNPTVTFGTILLSSLDRIIA